ncbi:isoprenyl transferase [Arcanobacterium urinimassiliense]|uniref:isoprenyl transferase n=1 Tax=Arcanobacterium urinimassiliense TaxID=1871014 RepID=UPI00093E1C85|nr:isoprenyl transferase [Arcanobacterium urinimassiliense]
MWIPNFVYSLYERSLIQQIDETNIPQHVGIILDGNRRWANSLGMTASSGHRKGAYHVTEVLEWCEEAHIKLVTLWMLSTDNLKRAEAELAELLDIIADLIEDMAKSQRWELRVLGDLDLLPPAIAARIKKAVASTSSGGKMQVNVAIGYGGRQEITNAVRRYLSEQAAQGKELGEVAHSITVSDITEHMYTRGQPDPDLIIRTSGEQRLSGFLLWQTVHTEFYFCETFWPDFRRTDFLRALRDFSARERRMGV